MAAARKKKSAQGGDQIATNRRARFQYHLDEVLEAGIVLLGTEAWLVGCHIGPYAAAARNNHEPLRERKLLLSRREIERLDSKACEKGLTLVVTRLYFKNGRIKAEVAVARGKKLHDKRQTVKERAAKKEMERAIKRYR